MGKCVVFVKAENGRIAAAFNEDGFTSVNGSHSPNLKGFIASVTDDGGRGEVFHRTDHGMGIWNDPGFGPVIGGVPPDFFISNNCRQNEYSYIKLGRSYGGGPGLNLYALFGQERFRVVEYEVFKIVIE
jgi:hypothetical protein